MIQMNALCYRQTGPARQVLNLEALPRPAPAKGEGYLSMGRLFSLSL